MARSKKMITEVGMNVDREEHLSLFVVIQTNEPDMEICVVLKKVEKYLPQSQLFQKDSLSYNRNNGTSVFIPALFIIPRK